jgi:hypothetical protein
MSTITKIKEIRALQQPSPKLNITENRVIENRKISDHIGKKLGDENFEYGIQIINHPVFCSSSKLDEEQLKKLDKKDGMVLFYYSYPILPSLSQERELNIGEFTLLLKLLILSHYTGKRIAIADEGLIVFDFINQNRKPYSLELIQSFGSRIGISGTLEYLDLHKWFVGREYVPYIIDEHNFDENDPKFKMVKNIVKQRFMEMTEKEQNVVATYIRACQVVCLGNLNEYWIQGEPILVGREIPQDLYHVTITGKNSGKEGSRVELKIPSTNANPNYGIAVLTSYFEDNYGIHPRFAYIPAHKMIDVPLIRLTMEYEGKDITLYVPPKIKIITSKRDDQEQFELVDSGSLKILEDLYIATLSSAIFKRKINYNEKVTEDLKDLGLPSLNT